MISISSFAQGIGFNYKAVIKDDNGNVMTNQNLKLKFTILGSGDNNVYEEVHTTITDNNGIVIVSIGKGTEAVTGNFYDIDWANDLFSLKTEIDTEPYNTFNLLGTTTFKSVPYSKHSITAENAANVFSGDYNDLSNQPTIITPSGLETIDEGNGIGWRLANADPENYGPIGSNSIDLSKSNFPTTTYGATGYNSFAVGSNVIASGNNTNAIGSHIVALGNSSIVIGHQLNAPSGYEIVIGRNNSNYTPNNPFGWDPEDRLFTIGGTSSNVNKSDALIILKNGTITAPRLSNSHIENANSKVLLTKSYVEENYLSNSSNMIPIAYGTIESNANVLSGTNNITASINAGVITISLINESMSVNDTSCVITPYSTAFRSSSIVMSSGDIQVRIFNSLGSLTPTTFQFVIYKL
ncbi:hypothetical protein [Winogradskyella sp. R77965]|uniref:hypothetical protein n=1 Tax=Winogradskyella sp. R77965 TaxID=3093872 RepID=UPI0037DCFE1C